MGWKEGLLTNYQRERERGQFFRADRERLLISLKRDCKKLQRKGKLKKSERRKNEKGKEERTKKGKKKERKGKV